MPTVLKLNEPGVKRAMRHPALEGAKLIGRGMFAAVYEKGDTILKVTCDQNQYAMYRDPHCPEGPYFPLTITDHGYIGETAGDLSVCLVEQERLEKLRGGPIGLTRRAKRLGEFVTGEMNSRYRHLRYHSGASTRSVYDMQHDATIHALEKAAANQEFDRHLRCALLDIAVFVSNYQHVIADFSMSNMMRRGDQLVLNDVIADGPSADHAWRQASGLRYR